MLRDKSAYSFKMSKVGDTTAVDSSDSSRISDTNRSMTTLSERNEDQETASPSPKKRRIIHNQEID